MGSPSLAVLLASLRVRSPSLLPSRSRMLTPRSQTTSVPRQLLPTALTPDQLTPTPTPRDTSSRDSTFNTTSLSAEPLRATVMAFSSANMFSQDGEQLLEIE